MKGTATNRSAVRVAPSKASKPAPRAGKAAGRTATANPTTKQQTSSKTAEKKGAGMADRSLLEKFLLDELKDIYWVEKHLVKALPKMLKAATAPELKAAIEEHIAVTEEHVTRAEKAFEILGKKAQVKKCIAMSAITEEGNEVVGELPKGTATRDAAIIICSQKIEHYEIASYGSLKQLALTLGNEELADVFESTLNDEKDADEKLTELAENCINCDAASEEEEA